MKKLNLIGNRFGRLTVIKKLETDNGVYWECKCDCGGTHAVTTGHLRSGHTTGCGRRCPLIYHGYRGHHLHMAWASMKTRCFNKKAKDYMRYGGRGITVCDDWINSFMLFRDWALTSGYKKGLTLDRIDVDGNYEPNNCKWATCLEQANNRRDTIRYKGETSTNACRRLGIFEYTIKRRIRSGWSTEDAFTIPLMKKYSNKKLI